MVRPNPMHLDWRKWFLASALQVSQLRTLCFLSPPDDMLGERHHSCEPNQPTLHDLTLRSDRVVMYVCLTMLPRQGTAAKEDWVM